MAGGMLDRLKRRQALKSGVLLDYESRIIESLTGAFEPVLTRTLRSQIDGVKPTRESDGMIVLFPNSGKAESRTANTYVENIPCYLFCHIRSETIRCELLVSEGVLVGLFFNKSPEALLNSVFSLSPVVIVTALNLEWRLQELEPEFESQVLREISMITAISKAFEPPSDSRLDRFLGRFGDPINKGWVEFLRETDYLSFAHSRFYWHLVQIDSLVRCEELGASCRTERYKIRIRFLRGPRAR